MFPGNFNLQGGGGINLLQPNSSLPINNAPAGNIQVQGPAVNPMNYAASAPVSYGGGGGGGSVSSGGGGGGGGGTSYRAAPAPPPDPYAKYGGQANYNNYLNNFNTQQQNVLSTSDLAAQNAYLGQNTSIGDKIAQWNQQQSNLDNQAKQNYLAKQSGNQGILDWVGQGIRSGGVTLANKNASNSSAGEAMARAYSQLGRQQMGGVNEQFAQAQDQVTQGKHAMDAEIAQNINDLPSWKQQTVNSIVSQAQQQLGQIDQTMAYLSMPQRVDMEAKKQAITQDTLGKLQSLDGALAKAQQIQPQSPQVIQSQANQLFQQGTAPENAFNYTTNAPQQFQQTGPFASDLPLFTYQGNKAKQTA